MPHYIRRHSLKQRASIPKWRICVFSEGIYEYALSHLPIDDPVLVNAEFVKFEDRESSSLSMPQYFVER